MFSRKETVNGWSAARVAKSEIQSIRIVLSPLNKQRGAQNKISDPIKHVDVIMAKIFMEIVWWLLRMIYNGPCIHFLSEVGQSARQMASF